MYQRITKHNFIESFRDMGRLNDGDGEGNFTPLACVALFDHFQELEDGMNEKIELDVIAICCDFEEHNGIEQAGIEYMTDSELADLVDDCDDDDEANERVFDWFQERTIVLEVPGTDRIVIQSF